MDDQDQILSYLADEMPSEKRQAFELRIQKEPALKAQLEEMRMLQEGLKETFAYQDIRSEAEAIVQKVKSQQAPSIQKSFSLYWAAAAAVFILAMAWLLWPGPSTDSLRQEYLMAYERPGQYKGTPQSPESRFRDAEYAYRASQFPQAIEGFSGILPSDSLYSQAQLFIGTAYLLMKSDQKAIQPLQRAHQDPVLQEYSRWYLGLAYLLTDQADLAKPLLESAAADTEGFMHQSALKLLKQF